MFMAHMRMLDHDPSAIITSGGSEKKIYQGGQIFINDGDNFEIRFFNPSSEKIGVEILFNGQKKNDGLLVLKPGEDIILDRFLGEKKKMRYETYTIDGGNDAAVKAAAVNGLVEFRFYREKSTGFTTFNTTNSNSRCYNSVIQGYSGTTVSGSNNTTIGINRSFTSNYQSPGVFCCDYDSYTTTSSANYKDYSVGSLDSTSLENTSGKVYRSKSVKKLNVLETGRIEKGPESSQDLKTVDVDFESNPFHIITYQLKPNSQRPTEITEIRNYCTKCAYRVRKSSWNFCPKCSEKL